jgi:branched-chain amino acid transport system permease protein
MSIEVLVMIMLGGFGTVSGPIIGAALYEEIRSYLIVNPLLQSMHLVIAGLLLLAIILFVPVGVVGWIRQRIPLVRRYLE